MMKKFWVEYHSKPYFKIKVELNKLKAPIKTAVYYCGQQS
jgi:hypothetical protein